MRVSNILEFTENHRYFACRDFALSGLDRRLFTALYQPVVGAFAAGFYHFLYHLLGEDETGSSRLEPQRALFLGLGVEPNAPGRKKVIRASSLLEAVGLLQVFLHENPVTEETIYEYVLLRPLDAAEFFSNVHLTLMLRDKIGQSAVIDLRSRWTHQRPAELARFVGREELTVPFYEIFAFDAGAAGPEIEAGWEESAPSRQQAPRFTPPEKIRYHDILKSFPRSASNRKYVEALNKAPETMKRLNFLAYRYDLILVDIVRLLDRDDMFRPDGTVHWDRFEECAKEIFRMSQSERLQKAAAAPEESPVEPPHAPDRSVAWPFAVPEKFRDTVSAGQYDQILRSEPYLKVLAWHFPGEVPEPTRRLYNRIFLDLKMQVPVINVLIHYVNEMLHTNMDQKNSAAFVESIASTMLAKGIETYEQAVTYVKEQQKRAEMLDRRRREEDGAGTGGQMRGRNQQRRKPAMPVVEDKGPVKELTSEEREKMRELARKLKGER